MKKSIDKSYVQLAQEYFLASPLGVDFSDGRSSAALINEWVEDQTNSKIKNLITQDDVGSLTMLVLVNAIYFKGEWEEKFKTEMTRKQDFFVSSTKTVVVDMMCNRKKYE